MTRVFFMFIALSLAGCATLPPPSMSVTDLSRYKLVATEIEGTEFIRSWPAQEQEFVASAAGGPEAEKRLAIEPASNIPGAAPFFKRVLETRVGAALNTAVGPAFVGQQPAIALVKIKSFDIPSVGRRILVGGAASMQIEIDLLDAKTRQPLVVYPGQYETVPLMGGALAPLAATANKTDTADELIEASVKDYRAWLIAQKGAGG